MDLRPLSATVCLLCCTLAGAQDEPVAPDRPAPNREETRDPDAALMMADEMPGFPGGEEELARFINAEIKYPREAIKRDIEGVVHLSFIVEKDGSITEPTVLRTIGGGCSEEALRVVRAMPRWNPGRQNGEVVRARCNLPIRFSLVDRKR